MRKKVEQLRAKVKAKAVKPARKVAKAATKKTTKPAKRRTPAPRSARPKPAGEKGCNTPSRVDVFVAEYLIDLNGRQAAIRAGYSPESARQRAAELLATRPVQEALTKAMVARAQRTGITADMVLQRFWSVATADPGELSEHYRGCCRYCWGKDNRYQRTPRELETARANHAAHLAEAKTEAEKLVPFDEAGGIGYDPRKDPNPECPECFGEGEARVFFKDTRDLSPDARRLYAGVKVTQHGLELKTHDPMTALLNVGKHLGMFRERVELTGKDGAELATGVVVVPAKTPARDAVSAPEEPPIAPALEPAAEEKQPARSNKPVFKVTAAK